MIAGQERVGIITHPPAATGGNDLPSPGQEGIPLFSPSEPSHEPAVDGNTLTWLAPSEVQVGTLHLRWLAENPLMKTRVARTRTFKVEGGWALIATLLLNPEEE